MALYTVSVRTPAAAANAPYCDLRTVASDRVRVREIGISVATAVASSVGLIRPNAVGTATSPVALQPQDPNDPAATATVGIAWSPAPTLAATPIYLRRTVIPATIGSAFIWPWYPAQELIVPVNSSLLLWNFGAAAGAPLDVWFLVDE
jgi:hypothetical protein